GPNSFSQLYWPQYYSHVCGMHNGLDHIVPVGTPLVALADGIIVGTQANWPFLGNLQDASIILWFYLPDSVRDANGKRMLSNVLAAYGHLSNNSIVHRHQEVKAGDVIGLSGYPVGEPNNAHLHLELHLLSGDNALPHPSSRRLLTDFQRPQPYSNQTPFNPLLFFSERLLKYHVHLGSKIGFGSGPTYPSAEKVTSLGLSWPPLDFFTIANFQYGAPVIWTIKNTPWPNGIYDLQTLNQRVKSNYTAFQPYPADFV
ncbi:MAG TPA: M23 family metallopeptidase, partial [Aggregatilineales bacterium]|nr:M23 family metallopeptidase [Aggregatilineales bacterium]